MKQDKNKIKEPYAPGKTPAPPQIIDPSIKKERNEEKRIEDPDPENPEKGQQPNKRRSHLLNEDAEIDDETTI